MIAPSDLRIGNWLQYNEGGTLFQVTEIHAIGIGVTNEEEETWIELDQFSPIPLTPEILEKSGFVVRDDNPKQKPHYEGDVLVTIVGFEFTNSDKGQANGGFYCYEINNGETVISSVHQLQNLYQALTGEELNISL